MGGRGEKRERVGGCLHVLYVERKGCQCWLFKAPPLFMFGNLRNRVKDGQKRDRMEAERERGFALPLWVFTDGDIRSP